MPSTVIRTFCYDDVKRLLVIEFVSGLVYHYKKVPLSVYNGFKASKSKGTYFNGYVKGKFAFRRVNTKSI